MAKAKTPSFFRWLLLLPIPALWCVLGHFGLFDFLENKTVDWRFHFRGPRAAPVKVAYVDVDAQSIADLHNQPWDRGYYVEVCQALLQAGKAKAIGIDYVFSEKGRPELLDQARFRQGNQALVNFLFSEPRVVVAGAYAAAEDRDANDRPMVRELPRVDSPSLKPRAAPELPEFRTGPKAVINAPCIGLIDTIDGGTRWVPIFAQVEDLRTYYHMAVQLARIYWGLPQDALKIGRDDLRYVRPDGTVQAIIPLTNHQDVEVNWFTPWIEPRFQSHFSFSEALEYSRMLTSDKPDEKAAATEYFSSFADTVVLIGPVDPLLQDLAPTPLDHVPVPRVGIHGNLLKTIVSGIYLRRPQEWAAGLLTLLLTAAVCGLAIAGGPRGGWWKAAAGLLLGLYALAAFVLFARTHFVVPMSIPLGAAFSTSFVGVTLQLFFEEKQKSRIRGMFGTYVSPELVTRLVESGEDPKLGGAEAEITAYFSDIENFSSFAEQLSPTQLVELMNEYLTACTDIVTKQGGTLDKYIGDAMVAMFGAPVALPDHAYRACVASQLVQQKLAELREKWTNEGSKWPSLVSQMHTRIGLNSGPAVVGNMGSLTRFNYTMMGDNVNLAARMESGAKSYGAATMVTDATRLAAERVGDRCVFRFLDRLVVKGRSQPVDIYEIVGLKDALSPRTRECVSLFEQAIEKYLRQDWVGASKLFEQSAAMEKDEHHGQNRELTPSSVYLQRCAAMKASPPGEKWDGVFVMKTK